MFIITKEFTSTECRDGVLYKKPSYFPNISECEIHSVEDTVVGLSGMHKKSRFCEVLSFIKKALILRPENITAMPQDEQSCGFLYAAYLTL